MDKIDKLTHDDLFMTELEAKEWDKWEENSKMDYAQKQGIEQEKIATIKNMIKKNISLNDIADITGKTITEIGDRRNIKRTITKYKFN